MGGSVKTNFEVDNSASGIAQGHSASVRSDFFAVPIVFVVSLVTLFPPRPHAAGLVVLWFFMTMKFLSFVSKN